MDLFDETKAREALTGRPGRAFTSEQERNIRRNVKEQLDRFFRNPQAAPGQGGVIIDPTRQPERDLRLDEIGWQYDCLPPDLEFGVIAAAA
jgi:hypothetical protein